MINGNYSDKKLLALLLRLEHYVLVIYNTYPTRLLECGKGQSRLPLGFLADFLGWTVFEGDLGCDKRGTLR